MNGYVIRCPDGRKEASAKRHARVVSQPEAHLGNTGESNQVALARIEVRKKAIR
jgi:hypothetical protein